ncbi:MAG: helix-turn-helix domain-containing protein [Saprospiraceae bacterium]
MDVTAISLLDILVIISVFLGMTLSVFLLFVKSARSKANIFLALIIFVWATILIPGFLVRADLLDNFPHIAKFIFYFDFLIGPSMYFYVRASTEEDFKWKPIYYLHFALFFFELVYNIPLMLLNASDTLSMYWEYIETGISPHSQLIPLLNMLHIIGYFGYACKLVLEYRKHVTNTSSSVDLAYHRWLLTFCILNVFPIFIFLILSVVGFEIFSKEVTVFCIFFLMISIYTATLFKPAIFHKFPHLKPQSIPTIETRQKYESSNLNETQKEAYLATIKQEMHQHKYYKEPELTIQQLAKKIEIPTTYLSQVINEKMGCTFLDFINQYRVEAAKKLLHDSNYDHYSILGIAEEAGFNSKSAFYSAFKRFTNTTPAKFRKSLIMN